MWFKRLVTGCLLVFIGITLGMLAVKGFRTSGATDASEVQDLAGTQKLEDSVIVYYFHGNTRCPTCRKIEAFTHDALQSRFSDQLVSGDVSWQVMNYEESANERVVERYDILAPIVVLSRIQGGKETAWSSLDGVWGLTDDKDAFAQYIDDEIRKLTGEAEISTVDDSE